MKLYLTSEGAPLNDATAFYVSAALNLTQIVKSLAPNSFDLVESQAPIANTESLLDKDFWKLLFSTLKENGDVNLTTPGLTEEQISQIGSLVKLNGFSNSHVTDSTIQAKKPQWQAVGAPLKRKQQE